MPAQTVSTLTSNAVIASGGNEVTTISGTYKFHVFTSSGTFIVTRGGYVEALLIGGGGGGNNTTSAEGGGAGGVILYPTLFLAEGNYPVTVGAAGVSANGYANNGGVYSNNNGRNVGCGGHTRFAGLVALGGAPGGGGTLNLDGSGGGGGFGTPPQGRDGATVATPSGGRPGGGYTSTYSGAGTSSQGWTIDAFTALLTSMSGMTVLASGGNGGANANHGGTGGGGGTGAGAGAYGGDGGAATSWGSGGGGAGSNPNHTGNGGAGKGGVCVIRYKM